MKASTSVAAEVRRQFRLGRPPKGAEHLRPLIAADKAEMLLEDLRNRMRQAGTKWFEDEHVNAMLVSVDDTDVCITPVENNRDKMLANLTTPGAYALGCVFVQFDQDAGKSGQNVFFYVPFIGLSDDERATIQGAAASWKAAMENTRAEGMN